MEPATGKENSSSNTDEVLTERRGHILVITLNRPHARNALNPAVLAGLTGAFDTLDGDPALRAGVVTGTAGTFSVGADLKSLDEEELRRMVRHGGPAVFGRTVSKPLVAAVEGFALGGGLELALRCDLIVAADDATMGLPEVRHGAVPLAGALLKLPTRIPHHIAMQLALTGDLRPAADFERWGLVNQLVPPGQALEYALELAERVCTNAPQAVSATKQILLQAADWPADEAWEKQWAYAEPAYNSADFTEGLRAFAERRAARWYTNWRTD